MKTDTAATAAAPAAEPSAKTTSMNKFDPDTLKGIASTSLASSTGAAFLPTTMGEAMELGKLMCKSNFVPPHLRDKPGDCLAVVLQAQRWGMDPFAVANKTYFVNDRIAYEAQLVAAVLNSRAPLEGRLRVEWDGKDQLLTCKVSGKIKGDPDIHIVWQELATITTRNSPLWKQSPRQQIAYYTTRMWARLYCPEVLLGVYTDDEVMDMGPVQIQDDGSTVIPPRPTRESVKRDTEAARKQSYEQDRQYRETMREDDDHRTQEKVIHDAETGEVAGDATQEPERTAEGANEPAQETAQEPQKPAPDYQKLCDELCDKVSRASTRKFLEGFVTSRGQDIDTLRTEAPALSDAFLATLKARRDYFAK